MSDTQWMVEVKEKGTQIVVRKIGPMSGPSADMVERGLRYQMNTKKFYVSQRRAVPGDKGED